MSQLTVKLSDRADALIAQLQKEIFNRRRKKVSAAGVIETLVESGAKSQSDKRFATSWKNLVSDIEKAAKVADAHGAKPANLSDEEWAMVLNHRTRIPRAAAPAKARSTQTTSARKPAARKSPSAKSAASKSAASKPAAAKAVAPKAVAAPKAKPRARKASVSTTAAASSSVAAAAKPAAKRPARKAAARKPVTKTSASTSVSTKKASSSVARRMAKAVSRLGASAPAAPSVNGAAKTALSV
jgi:hypothetical protein